MITSYYQALPPDVLTPSKLKCNAALRAAHMPIEKNTAFKAAFREFAMLGEDQVMDLFVPMPSSNSGSVTSSSTVTLCFNDNQASRAANDNQASRANTFAYPPPSIDWYLRL